MVDRSDQAEFLDDRDELATRDDGPSLVAHPQQTFEIIDDSGCRAHHRLESKHQPALAKCRLDRRPYSQVTPLSL